MFVKIYAAVLASLFLFALLVGLSWKIYGERNQGPDWEGTIAAEIANDILPESISADRASRVLQHWRERLHIDMALIDADGDAIAWAGIKPARLSSEERAAAVDLMTGNSSWDMAARARHGETVLLVLANNRVLRVVDSDDYWRSRNRHRGLTSIAGVLTLIALAVAIVAWPISRKIARNVESLRVSVVAFGEGRLDVRARVRGHDEIAALAVSFNQSADRIEQLIAAQKSLLANASHELRSPLARIRMAVELIDLQAGDQTGPARDELLRNVGELDDLVDEILLASRLDSGQMHADVRLKWGTIDLGGLLAEESARLSLEPDLVSLEMLGDDRLLRRVIRNLLENARRYGADPDHPNDGIVARLQLSPQGDIAVLDVLDRGPGVPADDKERIFEPFYRASGASERAGGVGLGLSLVRQIAKLHGGTIECHDRDGGGSQFSLRLPLRFESDKNA